ncbi:MAG TPA: TMEM175 family protein, partial [Rhodothermales bacterium]|nr:TMEM175 family protein [Rhodothermales bacterium]
VGIYWNNHHHLFQAIQFVNGKILLANLNLLFWISILPFATAWMGEHHFEGNTVALYGLILFLSAISFYLLEKAAIQHEGPESKLSIAVSDQYKERISLFAYAFGVILAFYYPIISLVLFYITALIWFIPDKRIEKILSS